jgi:hypothetical protein
MLNSGRFSVTSHSLAPTSELLDRLTTYLLYGPIGERILHT